MSNEQLIADLRATKQALTDRGRCTFHLVDEDGRVCLDGAVAAACGQLSFMYSSLERSPRVQAVLRALDAHVPADRKGNDPGDGPMENVYTFNDHPKTTDQDCYTLIDKALAEAGGLG